MKKKLAVLFAQLALIIFVLLCLFAIIQSVSVAEDLDEAWVICQPKAYVNVRKIPSRKSQSVGYLEAGDSFFTDGKQKNGFIRCYGIGENGEGWIHAGYVVYEEPARVSGTATVVSKAKLAARQYIRGKVIRWLKNMNSVKVYWMTDEWCVTNKGFVMTKYLDMEGV